MNSVIKGQVERIIEALRSYGQDVEEYERDPHEREADRKSWLDSRAAERDNAIAGAIRAIDVENERALRSYTLAQRSDVRPGHTDVANAWQKAKMLLDSGQWTVADVLRSPSFDRAMAIALTEFWPSYYLSKLRPEALDNPAVRAEIAAAVDSVVTAELPHMDPGIRNATEAERDRLAGMRAVEAIVPHVQQAQAGHRITGQDLIRIGFDLADADGTASTRQVAVAGR